MWKYINNYWKCPMKHHSILATSSKGCNRLVINSTPVLTLVHKLPHRRMGTPFLGDSLAFCYYICSSDDPCPYILVTSFSLILAFVSKPWLKNKNGKDGTSVKIHELLCWWAFFSLYFIFTTYFVLVFMGIFFFFFSDFESEALGLDLLYSQTRKQVTNSRFFVNIL